MNVSTRSWHGRVYRWWTTQASYQWRLNNPNRRRETLCHYVRVILFYAPAVWFLTGNTSKRRPWVRPWMVVVAVVGLSTLTACLAAWPGPTLVAVVKVAAGLGVSALALGVVVGATWIIQQAEDRKAKRANQPTEDRGPSFLGVLWAYTKAAKRRVCPFIDVDGPGVKERVTGV